LSGRGTPWNRTSPRAGVPVRDGWEKSLFRVYVWDVLWSLFGERLLCFEIFFDEIK
jgi:hypothetical protein